MNKMKKKKEEMLDKIMDKKKRRFRVNVEAIPEEFEALNLMDAEELVHNQIDIHEVNDKGEIID